MRFHGLVNALLLALMWSMAISVILLQALSSDAFSAPTSYSRLAPFGVTHNYSHALNAINKCEERNSYSHANRRQILTTSLSSIFLLQKPKPALGDIEGVVTPSTPDPKPISDEQGEGVILYTTKSGLKYIDLGAGTGPTPRYGQLCSISYVAYIKLPDTTSNSGEKEIAKLQKYDSDSAYLIKHGNGRMIPGLDEGLHTMKVGSKRRIIIPPKLGYVGPGVLGPLPESPIGRWKLNKLLNQMIAVRGGSVVMDVELRSVIDDEADQGYYEDGSLTPDEFNKLRMNLQESARGARADGRAAVDILSAVE